MTPGLLIRTCSLLSCARKSAAALRMETEESRNSSRTFMGREASVERSVATIWPAERVRAVM